MLKASGQATTQELGVSYIRRMVTGMDNVSTWLVVGGMLLLAVAIVVLNDWTVAWFPDVEVGKGLTPGKYEIRIDREKSPATGGGRKKMTGDNGGKSGGDSVEPGSGR